MTIPPMKVCVVEDESRLRELLVRELGAMGFAAIGFRTAEDAWPALERGEFHVAMLDLNLPGLGGMELFQRVREKTPEVATVILTGFGTLDSAVQALRWGAADYLTKPCSLDQIEAVLVRLDRARHQAEHARHADSSPSESAETAAPARVAAPLRTLEDLEREQILAAMREHGGNKPLVAQTLGISLRTLYNKLNIYRDQGRLS